MKDKKYPTGVESHGGFLRISFTYQGVRMRESLSVPDTLKNRNKASQLRESVVYAIKTGNFDYAKTFPESKNLRRFSSESGPLTLLEAFEKWMTIKEAEVSISTFSVYRGMVKTVLSILNGNRMIDSLNVEDLLSLRMKLLKGSYMSGRAMNIQRNGRSVAFVNGCMTLMSSLFKFAHDSGYVGRNISTLVSPLKRDKPKPDPLTRDEFTRLHSALRSRQIKNIWSIAVFTGMRHGEICALTWGDVDTKNRTINVRRNLTSKGYFTVPKTDSGIRKIYLIDSAWEAICDQMELTRMMPEREIKVIKREYGKRETEVVNFVFNPQVNSNKKDSNYHYSVLSLSQTWKAALKIAGITDRKAYQSRHTYACWSLAAGANPNFIANQMGHANAQMVHNVYGSWMPENDETQRAILNNKLNEFAPSVPHELKAVNI